MLIDEISVHFFKADFILNNETETNDTYYHIFEVKNLIFASKTVLK